MAHVDPTEYEGYRQSLAKSEALSKALPPLDCSDDAVLEFVKRTINPEANFRRWNMLRAAENIWFYRGRHWIEAIGHLRPDANGQHLFRFSEVYRDSSASFPRPVTNFIGPAVDNEVARLIRRDYVATTRTMKGEPRYAEAARMAKNILLHDLRRQYWPDIKEETTWDCVVTSTAVMRSVWDSTIMDLMSVASPDAMSCPGCDARFGSSTIPREFAEMGVAMRDGDPQELRHADSLQDVETTPGRPAEVRMTACPFCEPYTPLQPYDVSEQEAEGGLDAFERPLGLLVPRGEGLIENVGMFDIYPENGGLVEPRNCRIWGQRTVRSLDWLFSRHPKLEGLVEPEAPDELMRYHPTLGDDSFSLHGRGYSATGDRSVYPAHVMVDEVHIQPIGLPGLELGRSFLVAGGHVGVNDTLVQEVKAPNGKTVKVPRVQYAAARFRRIPGEFYGRSKIDNMKPLNRRLNELDAMMIDIRERGSPQIYKPDGVRIIKKPWDTGSMRERSVENLPGVEYDVRKWLFPGQPLTGNNYLQEREAIIRDMEKIGFPPPVEQGFASGIRTTTGIMHQTEEAAVERNPTIQALVRMYEQVQSHHLELTWAFRQEEGEYEIEMGTEFERRAYRGANLMDGMTVRLEQATNVESILYEKEAAAEAFQMGLYGGPPAGEGPLSPDMRNKLLEKIRAPKDLNEDRGIQIERAEALWDQYLVSAEVPPIDESLEEHAIWFDILGRRWQGQDGRKLQEEQGWAEVLPMLAGWERKLQQATELDEKQRLLYEQHPPESWPDIYAHGEELASRAAAERQASLEAGTPVEQVGPPVTPMTPPPEDGFLPDDMMLRILRVWGQMGIEHPMLRMRARIEAHRLLAEAKQRELQMGGVPAEAPGMAQAPAAGVGPGGPA